MFNLYCGWLYILIFKSTLQLRTMIFFNFLEILFMYKNVLQLVCVGTMCMAAVAEAKRR